MIGPLLTASGLSWAQGGAPAAKDAVGLEAPFTFAVVADPHCGEEARWRPEQYGTHIDRFLKCVNVMKMEGLERPDFMLLLGDIHPSELKKHLGAIDIPMHMIAGNHEFGDKKRELRGLCPQDFQINGSPSDYYAFVHKGVRFIGICDSGSGGDHIGHLCSEDIAPSGQCEWLEKELGQRETLKIVFGHIPPHPAWPESRDENMFMSRNDSKYFNDLISKTMPTAAFFGHLHKPTEKRKSPARIFTVRSCAWNFNDEPVGFLLVTMKPEGIEVREVLTSDDDRALPK